LIESQENGFTPKKCRCATYYSSIFSFDDALEKVTA